MSSFSDPNVLLPFAPPRRIAVFPLAGAVLLPRAVLPLNIFEPRYLAMVRDAIAGDGVIGMIQPKGDRDPPALYAVGGLGKISAVEETDDGRILLALTGLHRFRIEREVDEGTPYRQVDADYAPFVGDAEAPAPLGAAERAGLEETLKAFIDARGYSADWDAVKEADDESLINTLSVVCPFEPVERQALLEARDLRARADTLAALMAFSQGMSAAEGSAGMQ